MAVTVNEFKCALCKGVFEKGRPEEEAVAEYAEVFGGSVDDAEEKDVVCEDCWLKIDPRQWGRA